MRKSRVVVRVATVLTQEWGSATEILQQRGLVCLLLLPRASWRTYSFIKHRGLLWVKSLTHVKNVGKLLIRTRISSSI